MRYTVEEKTAKQESGKEPILIIGMWAPRNSKWIVLPVEQDEFDSIAIGDTIEILISVVQPVGV